MNANEAAPADAGGAAAGERCQTCAGTGKVPHDPNGDPIRCEKCKGTGRLPAPAGGEPSLEVWRAAVETVWDSATNAVCQTLQDAKMCNCPDGRCYAAEARIGEPIFRAFRRELARPAGGEGETANGRSARLSAWVDRQIEEAVEAEASQASAPPPEQVERAWQAYAKKAEIDPANSDLDLHAFKAGYRAALAAGERVEEGKVERALRLVARERGRINCDDERLDEFSNDGDPDTLNVCFQRRLLRQRHDTSTDNGTIELLPDGIAVLARAPAAPSAAPDAATVERCMEAVKESALPFYDNQQAYAAGMQIGASMRALRALRALQPAKERDAT